MLDCKTYSEIMKRKILENVSILPGQPKMTVIQIGDDPSVKSYISGMKKDFFDTGMDLSHVMLNEDILTFELANLIQELNTRPEINGIFICLPLPKHIDHLAIRLLIDKAKDIDCFGFTTEFEPCTPKGIINYLEYCNYSFKGKNACVVGRSETVGKPLAKMLLDKDCTVTICHSKTNEDDLRAFMSESNIVFTCTNQIEKFGESYLSVLQDVIDFGMGIGKDGKMHGNIKKETAECLKESNKENGHIVISGTGGTGLLTRIALLSNVLKAYRVQNGMLAPYWL